MKNAAITNSSNIKRRWIYPLIILMSLLGWIVPTFGAPNLASGQGKTTSRSHASAHASTHANHANHATKSTAAKQTTHHTSIKSKTTNSKTTNNKHATKAVTSKHPVNNHPAKTANKSAKTHASIATHPKHGNSTNKSQHKVSHAKHKHPHHTTPAHARPAVILPSAAPAANTVSTTDALETETSATGKRIVSYVDNLIASVRYTRYRSGGTLFDTMHGICEADCSHYVDHILQKVCPDAYSRLESSTGSVSPDSKNYYDFFSVLPNRGTQDWDQVNNAKQLQAGDVLVFRYLNGSGISSGGHVMMVMDKPTIENNALVVRVSDSANASHSDDTRSAHGSGVGIGTMLLKINPYTGHPSAFAWDVDSRWQDRVKIAMARPIEVA